jgi:hypothetical protein
MTVLAVLRVRVVTRWIRRSRAASIDTGDRIPSNEEKPMYALLTRFLIRSREYRNPDGWMRVRLACAIFDFCLGLALLAAGVWEGAIPLAASALIFWTRGVLRHSTQS